MGKCFAELIVAGIDAQNWAAGSGVHASSNVGLTSCSISAPVLLNQSQGLTLSCTISLQQSSMVISSDQSPAHLRGSLTDFAGSARMAGPLQSSSVTSVPATAATMLLTVSSIARRRGGAIAAIEDRRQDHSAGHWAQPAILDCSLHLATALAATAGATHTGCYYLEALRCARCRLKTSTPARWKAQCMIPLSLTVQSASGIQQVVAFVNVGDALSDKSSSIKCLAHLTPRHFVVCHHRLSTECACGSRGCCSKRSHSSSWRLCQCRYH